MAALRRCSNGHEEVQWKVELLPGRALTETERKTMESHANLLERTRARFGVNDDDRPVDPTAA